MAIYTLRRFRVCPAANGVIPPTRLMHDQGSFTYVWLVFQRTVQSDIMWMRELAQKYNVSFIFIDNCEANILSVMGEGMRDGHQGIYSQRLNALV